MGFYSYKCRGCSHPLLSRYATSRLNNWMEDVVIIHKTDGVVARGAYDGYGRIPRLDGAEMYTLGYNDETDQAKEACWHRACWQKAGEPAFDKASDSADDQGYFFNEGDHDMPDPMSSETT